MNFFSAAIVPLCFILLCLVAAKKKVSLRQLNASNLTKSVKLETLEYELSALKSIKHAQNRTSAFDENEATDFLRWSYAPGFVEKWCRKSCKAIGKPFGRLLGVGCQCLCPLNAAPELGLCPGTGACDKFCASIGFSKGGDCVFNNICFCYCKKREKYDVRTVYTADR